MARLSRCSIAHPVASLGGLLAPPRPRSHHQRGAMPAGLRGSAHQCWVPSTTPGSLRAPCAALPVRPCRQPLYVHWRRGPAGPAKQRHCS
eukprot:scaffold401_cov399-Prasinococcus_capsulatus_cf.AAC.47